MFNDGEFMNNIYEEQEKKFESFLKKFQKEMLAIIEVGAGRAVPTIRYIGENIIN